VVRRGRGGERPRSRAIRLRRSAPRSTGRPRPAPKPPVRPAKRPTLSVRSRAPRGAEALPEMQARRRAARRTALTGRAAILAVVLTVLGLSIAYPLRQYLVQRAEINRLSEQIEAQQRGVAELQAERARWDDQAYIRAQARERLHFCMPDETCYITVDEGAAKPASKGGDKRQAAGSSVPWYSRLGQSIADANSAATGAASGR
jgi:cell division protein FtsB